MSAHCGCVLVEACSFPSVRIPCNTHHAADAPVSCCETRSTQRKIQARAGMPSCQACQPICSLNIILTNGHTSMSIPRPVMMMLLNHEGVGCRSDLAAGMLPAVRPASASKQKPAHIPATANPPFAHPAKLPTRAAAPPLQQDIPMVPSSPPAGPKHPAEAEQQLQQPVAAETPSVPLTRRVTRGSSEKGGSGKHESPLFRQDSATASPRGNASPNRCSQWLCLIRTAAGLSQCRCNVVTLHSRTAT